MTLYNFSRELSSIWALELNQHWHFQPIYNFNSFISCKEGIWTIKKSLIFSKVLYLKPLKKNILIRRILKGRCVNLISCKIVTSLSSDVTHLHVESKTSANHYVLIANLPHRESKNFLLQMHDIQFRAR